MYHLPTWNSTVPVTGCPMCHSLCTKCMHRAFLNLQKMPTWPIPQQHSGISCEPKTQIPRAETNLRNIHLESKILYRMTVPKAQGNDGSVSCDRRAAMCGKVTGPGAV